MAPEQLSKEKIDQRTDLFALGIVLYRMFTGALPFTGDSIAAVANSILSKEPKYPSRINPSISDALSGILLRCLAKKPEDRFEVLKPLCEAAGCKLEQFYVSGIENKAYLVIESPDLSNVYIIGTNFLASGAALSIKYIPLLTVAEVVDLCKKAASIAYRPPGK